MVDNGGQEVFKMNTKELKVLTVSDYGSTYQGLADKYSDVDTFALVELPLSESLFQDTRNQSTQDGDGRTLITPQRLVELSIKASSHSLIMLSAQLKQHQHNSTNQRLFQTFYTNEDAFSNLLYAKRGTLVRSLLGLLTKDLKKADKAYDNGQLTGKMLLQVSVDINRLAYLMAWTLGQVADTLNYDNFIHDITFTSGKYHVYDLQPFIDMKRDTGTTLKSKLDLPSYHEERKQIVKQLEAKFHRHENELKDETYRYETQVKDDVLHHLVAQYHKKGGHL